MPARRVMKYRAKSMARTSPVIISMLTWTLIRSPDGNRRIYPAEEVVYLLNTHSPEPLYVTVNPDTAPPGQKMPLFALAAESR